MQKDLLYGKTQKAKVNESIFWTIETLSEIGISRKIIDEMVKSDFNEAYQLWFVK